MEPLVTIIVPVYNAQDFLERCINSVLAQEYTNLELLLVDDGSKDESGAICDAFAAQDARVRVIHKENTGVSDSRNQALNQAKGDYLQFLDSDDWLTPDATRQFVRSAESYHSDMVIADFYRVIGDTISHKGDIEKEELLTREEFAGYMMENPADFYYGVLWNKLYRRDIIEKNQLRMDANISWCEDFIFNLEYLRHCHTIYALQAPVYYYVKTKGSLVNSQGTSINNTIRMKLNVFEYYQQFYREVYDEKSYEEIRFQVYRFLLTYAKDGFVPPAFLPGGRKLGQERLTAVLPEALEGDSIALDYYCYRKLWEKYCEIAAVKNDMTLDEVQVLVYLNQGLMIYDLKQLSDLTGISMRKLASVVQKLEKRQMIRRVNMRKETLAAHMELLMGKGENRLGDNELLIGKGENCSGDKELLIGKGEDCPGDKELLIGKGEDCPGDKELLIGKGENCSGDKKVLVGKGERHPGDKEFLTGKGENRPGEKELLTGKGENGPNDKKLLSGRDEMLLLGKKSPAENVTLQSIGQFLAVDEVNAQGNDKELKKGRLHKKRYELLPEAAPVLHDLELAEKDFNEIWLRNLSEKEKVSYQKLSTKIREGVKSFLRG